MYNFEFKDLEFGKGSLAELIAYDRYAITTRDFRQAKEGDIAIYVKDVEKNTQAVGTITYIGKNKDFIAVEPHDGSASVQIPAARARLVLETKPIQMWDRWARGAASIELGHSSSKHHEVLQAFRWLLDGYRYVPGGRIQAMLGQEFADLGLPKSRLSAYNCLVLPSPKCSYENGPLKNWLEILHVAKREANSMAYGCGVGLNISSVPETIEGPLSNFSVGFSLSDDHPELKVFGNYENFPNVNYTTEGEMLDGSELIEVEDSRFGIFDALMEMVTLIYQGKKIHIDFSQLREKGAYVEGIDGVSSGAISWMKLFDFVVGLLRKGYVDTIDIAELYAFIPHLISQGGQRRGALMLVLNVDHPRIMEFIKAKSEDGRITGANLSVNLTREFMEFVADGYYFAEELLDMIAEYAHKSAEPGVLFMDRVNKLSNTSYYQTINAVNPCAEEPLPPNGVCNLSHFNLPMFMYKASGSWCFDWEKLARAIPIAVRFNDNIIDYGEYFDPEIKAEQIANRRIGIGTMGLATVLIRLGIRYGSMEAEVFAKRLNRFIAERAYMASVKLAEEKGSFPNFNSHNVTKDSFLYQIFDGKVPMRLRNAALLTQAPTGSTGTMIDNLPGYNCSTGIEPYFAFNYYRASRLGVVEQEVGLVKEWKESNPGQELPNYFVCANDLPTDEHIRMQGAIQKYVDAAISKTINMPADAAVSDVRKAYLLAYQLGCKGVTVYRDGSRAGQVLATDKQKAKLEEATLSTDHARKDADFTRAIEEAIEIVDLNNIRPREFRKRPRVLRGKTVKQNTPMGKMYVTLNTSDGINIEEVFIHLGKVGSDIRAIVDALGILLTLGLSDRLSSLSQEESLKPRPQQVQTQKGYSKQTIHEDDF